MHTDLRKYINLKVQTLIADHSHLSILGVEIWTNQKAELQEPALFEIVYAFTFSTDT